MNLVYDVKVGLADAQIDVLVEAYRDYAARSGLESVCDFRQWLSRTITDNMDAVVTRVLLDEIDGFGACHACTS